MAILVSGGCGFVGAHTVVELLNCGEDVVIVDNLCNSSIKSLSRIEKITGKIVGFYQIDLCDKQAVDSVFAKENIDTVIHFAALKAVGESVKQPLKYYSNNIVASINLLENMQKYRINNFVFSSSATVYGNPKRNPIKENATRSFLSPYGASKIFVEDVLRDYCNANASFNAVLLRYFNPVGAHPSYLIGENPNGVPNNIMPYITGVAVGKLKELRVFGNDYNTIDGTCIRDYVHVVDVARGHIRALEKVRNKCCYEVYNLGSGKGVSVLQLIKSFKEATSVKLNYSIADRRDGDVVICYADIEKARKELKWSPKFTLHDMCVDHYNWQLRNPNGYDG